MSSFGTLEIPDGTGAEMTNFRLPGSKRFLQSTDPNGDRHVRVIAGTGSRVHYRDWGTNAYRTARPQWVHEGGGVYAMRQMHAHLVVDVTTLRFRVEHQDGTVMKGRMLSWDGTPLSGLTLDPQVATVLGGGSILSLPGLFAEYPNYELRFVWNGGLRPVHWIKSATCPRDFRLEMVSSDLSKFRFRGTPNDGRDNIESTAVGRGGPRNAMHRTANIEHSASVVTVLPDGDEHRELRERWTGEVAMWDNSATNRRWSSDPADIEYPVRCNFDIDVTIASNSDDVYAQTPSGPFNTGNSYIFCNWYTGGGGKSFWTGFRFASVAVPSGSTIDLGQIRVRVRDYSATTALSVRGSDSDDAAAWANTAGNRPYDRGVVSTKVDWDNSAGSPPENDVLISCSTVIKDIVDRAGYAEDHMALILAPFDANDSPIGNWKQATIEDYGATWGIDTFARPAQLEIDYTVAAGGSVIPAHIQRQHFLQQIRQH